MLPEQGSKRSYFDSTGCKDNQAEGIRERELNN